MKKILMVIIFLFSLNSQVFAEVSDVKIYVLGEKVTFDSKPQIVNGNTLVPMRPLFEALGATVVWNEKEQLVTGTRGDLSTQVYINQTTAYAGKKSIELEEAPRIIEGSTYVPLRFISESFGIDVNWDPANNAINVGKPYEAKDISKLASNAVVFIETFKNNQPLASGSGFITDKVGVVVTNYHVIDGSTSAIVRTVDGKVINIRSVIDYDKNRDIAILQLENTKPLQTVVLGDSDNISNGDKIFAIGSPRTLENSISDGIIGNKSRNMNGYNYIQFSAPISPGSSGGALLNSKSEVIGIPTLARIDSQNINFAIPINDLKKLIGTKNITLADINKKEHTIVYTDGIYEGGIVNGKKEGIGTLRLDDGTNIYGNWKNDMINGKAIAMYSDKSSYTGDFVDAKRQGYGVAKYPDGTTFEGDFYNDNPNGKGTFIHSNGETYTGDVKNGTREGYGVYRSNNGRVYSGLWANGEFIR